MSRGRAAVALLVGVLALVAGCGVEVPDDVVADIEASTTTTEDTPRTTETPTSDDELEQALIDNGYTLDEARCGAANLREALDDDAVRSIIDADTIEDISSVAARAFADALRPCVEDGASSGSGGDDGDDGDDGDSGGNGPLPGFGDDSGVDVSRSRFLAALISAGVGDDEARCVVEAVFDQLDQDDVNALFHAESEDDLPAALYDAFTDILDTCGA